MTLATVRSFAIRLMAVSLLLLTLIPNVWAQSGEGRRSGPGTGDPYELLVPWKFHDQGSPLVTATLVLYWLPATDAEAEHSPLLSSRELLQDGDRCVRFEIIVPSDAMTIAKLGQTAKLPMALLVDARGVVVRHVEGSRGRLAVAAVEGMVRDELNARDGAMYTTMKDAKAHTASGDKERAIVLYKELWDERCLFPLAGEQAQHALKDLGVTVVEPANVAPVDPNLPAPGLPSKPKEKQGNPHPA